MKWFKLNIECKDSFLKVRNKPAVYAIYIGGDLVYIGQSGTVRTRLMRHIETDFSTGRPYTRWGREAVFVKIKYSEKFGDWLMWEARLLRKIHPKGNTKTYKWHSL